MAAAVSAHSGWFSSSQAQHDTSLFHCSPCTSSSKRQAVAGKQKSPVSTAVLHAAMFRLTELTQNMWPWQGRYILSRPFTTNLRVVRDALQAEFPDVAFQDVEPNEPFQIVDSSRVSPSCCTDRPSFGGSMTKSCVRLESEACKPSLILRAAHPAPLLGTALAPYMLVAGHVSVSKGSCSG